MTAWRVCGASVDVIQFQARIVIQEIVRGYSLGQKAQHKLHRYPQDADDWLAAKYIRAGSDTCQQFLVGMASLLKGPLYRYHGTRRLHFLLVRFL